MAGLVTAALTAASYTYLRSYFIILRPDRILRKVLNRCVEIASGNELMLKFAALSAACTRRENSLCWELLASPLIFAIACSCFWLQGHDSCRMSPIHAVYRRFCSRIAFVLVE
jgi:hypothetical protein